MVCALFVLVLYCEEQIKKKKNFNGNYYLRMMGFHIIFTFS